MYFRKGCAAFVYCIQVIVSWVYRVVDLICTLLRNNKSQILSKPAQQIQNYPPVSVIQNITGHLLLNIEETIKLNL